MIARRLMLLALVSIGCTAGRIEVRYGRLPSPSTSVDCNVEGTLANLDGREMSGVIVELRQGKRRLVTWTREWGHFCFSGVPPGEYDVYYWGEDADDEASASVHHVFVRPLLKASIHAWADLRDNMMMTNSRIAR